VHVLRVYRCESAAEAAALAVVRGPDGAERPAAVGELAALASRMRRGLAG
jgi:hypothetical protein